jgi:hypothetical protein
MNNLAVRTPTVPNARVIIDLARDGDDIVALETQLRQALSAPSLEVIAAALEATDRSGELLARFASTRRALAVRRDDEDEYRGNVSLQLAMLLGSFPTSNVPDVKVFTRMLLDEVMAENVDAITLQAACQKIRRTSKFVPTISETLATIEQQRKLWTERVEAARNVHAMTQELERARYELEAKAAGAEGRAHAAQLVQDRLEVDLPVATVVFHPKLGKGQVIGHRGQRVKVSFMGSLTTRGHEALVIGSELKRIVELRTLPSAGQAIVHAWFGPGTVGPVEANGSSCTVAFEDGRRRLLVLANEKLWTEARA